MNCLKNKKQVNLPISNSGWRADLTYNYKLSDCTAYKSICVKQSLFSNLNYLISDLFSDIRIKRKAKTLRKSLNKLKTGSK
jgi:hypothetical protein